MTKKEQWQIEQAMVYFFKRLPDFIEPTREMSKRRRDSLWSMMCTWCDEYKTLVDQENKIEVRN